MNFTKKIENAEKELRKVFSETPLQYSKYLSKKYKAKIYLKREDLSPVRSYKFRGAYYFISHYLEKNPDSKNINFVCASAGNHAQGFAFSCARFKVHGKVYMPITTPQQKIEKTKDFGGKYVEVILVGDTYDQASTEAKKVCKSKNTIFVPPYDHEWTIAGAGTVGLEILNQCKDKIDFVFVPVGGGGLASGVSSYFAENSSETEIVTAEPVGAPSLTESLNNGCAADLKNIDTFVDGAAVGHFGDLTCEILKKNLKNPPILIPENRLCQTMLDFLHHKGIVLEPAGGLSIDALKDKKEQIKDKTVVCVISGGNFDFERLQDIKERAMRFSGEKKYLILRLPQRPGALKEFLNLLGPDEDIARFEYLKKSAKNFGSVLLGIETKKPKNFETLFKKMQKNGFDFTDVTDDELLADFVI